MERACEDLEAEIADLEAEADLTLESIRNAIGGLSDLRYGRFGKAAGGRAELGEEVVEVLGSMVELGER